jgi:hypothetical protein
MVLTAELYFRQDLRLRAATDSCSGLLANWPTCH